MAGEQALNALNHGALADWLNFDRRAPPRVMALLHPAAQGQDVLRAEQAPSLPFIGLISVID